MLCGGFLSLLIYILRTNTHFKNYIIIIVVLNFDATSFPSGAWADRLGAMAGVKVPIVSMKHGYVVTERIEGIRNMPNVRDHDLTLYVKLQGDTLQVSP